MDGPEAVLLDVSDYNDLDYYKTYNDLLMVECHLQQRLMQVMMV